mmetsp:Transcript_297/g.816  ORF Transcript_297/g.816 Transcript_297/m.816 type:complete len:188 (+) Transcript_297:324-887(+)
MVPAFDARGTSLAVACSGSRSRTPCDCVCTPSGGTDTGTNRPLHTLCGVAQAGLYRHEFPGAVAVVEDPGVDIQAAAGVVAVAPLEEDRPIAVAESTAGEAIPGEAVRYEGDAATCGVPVPDVCGIIWENLAGSTDGEWAPGATIGVGAATLQGIRPAETLLDPVGGEIVTPGGGAAALAVRTGGPP